MRIEGKWLVVVTISVFCLAPVAHGGSLDIRIIAMFPKNIAELAHVDLTEARKFPWFSQFKAQALPPRFTELENLLAASGVTTDSQINGLTWALASGDDGAGSSRNSVPTADPLLGIALGSFDSDLVKDALKARNVSDTQVRGYQMYPCGSSCQDLYIVFLDSSTIAFGQQSLLERMLEARSGADDSLLQSDDMLPLISQINGSGIFWRVLNSAGAHQAIRQIMPEVSVFQQATKLLDKMNALVITVGGSNDLEVHLQLVSSSSKAAATFSQLMQAGLLLRQYQASKSDRNLAALLDSVRILANGLVLEVSFSVTNDQAISLLHDNAFSMKRSGI